MINNLNNTKNKPVVASSDIAESDTDSDSDIYDSADEEQTKDQIPAVNDADNENDDEQENDGEENETSETETETEKESNKETEHETEREDCMYSFSKKDDEEGSDDLDYESEDEQINVTTSEYVPDNERISKPYLTKYEYVRILGDRTKQLIEGAKPLIKNYKNLSPKEIAKLEIKYKTIPFYIHRTLPSGKIERWKVSELSILE